MKGKVGESYNVSSNGKKNNYVAIDEIASSIVRVVAELHEKEPVNVRMTQSAPRKPGLSLNNDKLVSLGWAINTDFCEGLKATIAKMSQH